MAPAAQLEKLRLRWLAFQPAARRRGRGRPRAVRSSPSTEPLPYLADRYGVTLFGLDSKAVGQQRGLVATGKTAKGNVLMRVPTKVCLILDYDVGLSITEASWPRLKEGLSAVEPLPWDVLFALALVDAATGHADRFWVEYVPTMLPHPMELTVPFCQAPAALAELQHQQVQEAAEAQQERLATVFPDLAAPALDVLEQCFASNLQGNAHIPSAMQWAMACVRSRAFQLDSNIFAYVPFLDVANHSPVPNADFRCSQEDGAVELVATVDMEPGDEVLISYTGPKGATNRRMLVQYGFLVPENPFDRLDLGLQEGYVGSGVQRGAPGSGLSLDRLMMHMGDKAFARVMRGEPNVALLNAMKSLPTYDQVVKELPDANTALEQEAHTVGKLKERVRELQRELSTSIAEDEELLGTCGPVGTEWLGTCLRYRLERKKLITCTSAVLDMYTEIVKSTL